jgi:hypothetical protein
MNGQEPPEIVAPEPVEGLIPVATGMNEHDSSDVVLPEPVATPTPEATDATPTPATLDPSTIGDGQGS